ncbi:TM2 domain-containing protein [Mycobacterium sp. M1]|uniref:TM2 domain-containing protein n=1 Tax=Mycolicibacter acidiphilus TaxID=2835306 RepID=A0ABS5RDW1_9MYCO|nr:TM2 domain-containing protein [Mycolicibacter acidiphilus]MBS9532152.1 TM2 domain-containing protein [Mycolicibacter acidiphilus]
MTTPDDFSGHAGNASQHPTPGGYPPPQPGAYPQTGYHPQQGYPQYPTPGGGYGYGGQLSDKSKIVAGLLQIFLGGFGVGRFYLGYTGIGIAQIAATWLTFGLGAIWPFIDGILMLVGKVPDAQGRPLRD